MTMDREERICRYLAACPPAVSGQKGHTQTYAVACNLYNGFAMTQAELEYWLARYNERCQPPWDEGDLSHKVSEAMNSQFSRPRGCLIDGNGKFDRRDFDQSGFVSRQKPAKTPTEIDPTTAIEIYLRGFRCSEGDLYEASPIKPSEDWLKDGVLLLKHLYLSGEIINFVTEFKMSACANGTEKAVPSGYGLSVERDQLIDEWDLVGMPQSDAGGWMRMNPIDGKGIKDDNVTSYRFILCEFDSIPLDLQVSLFARLPLPISAILTSGGKSVHAWVRCDSRDKTGYKDDAQMLLKMLERFGLDGKNKNPARLSRLVGAKRLIGGSGDGRQRLLYINPNPSQERIIR